MSLAKVVLGVCCAVWLSGSAHAQISVDQLSAAQNYDAGVLQAGPAGGFDGALWQGVTAVQATDLIEKTNLAASGSARNLIRTALLSGGVPPKASDNFEREAYLAARLSAILDLGEAAAFDTILEQSEINRANPRFTKLLVHRALQGGDMDAACAITDSVTIERKSPYWAKMRAFCHVIRNEIPAAELTADLLARTGHQDKIFFDLLGKLTGTRPNAKITTTNTALHTAMLRRVLQVDNIRISQTPVQIQADIALDVEQASQDRLKALISAASLLTPNQIRTVLGGLADAPIANADAIDDADWDATIWGGVYLAATKSKDMDTKSLLTGALLKQAKQQGVLPQIAQALADETSGIPAPIKAKFNPDIFARTAVLRGDIDTLRGLFQVLEADDPLRGRIALAADALGNGFMFGELGVDIETRLARVDKKDAKVKARAVRDTYIAVALGANLSNTAEEILRQTKLEGSTIQPGALLGLRAAAKRGSKAEIALRAAPMIDGKPLRADAFAAVLSIMVDVGMHEQSGKLAALDFLDWK